MAWRKPLFAYLSYLGLAAVASALLVVLSDPLERLFQPLPRGVHDYRFWLAVAGSTVLWVGLFAVLHRLPSRGKQRVVVAATFVAGTFYLLEYFLPGHSGLFFWRPAHGNPFTPLKQPVGYAASVVAGFTFFLATLNLVRNHARNLARLKAGWYNSLAFFIAFQAMATFGLWNAYVPENELAARWQGWLFGGLYVPLNATLFSVLAFYMATAAFRAFRVRSAEAGL